MRNTRGALQLWPGLPHCLQGSFAGLFVAVSLAIALDIAVVSTYGWSELLPPRMRTGLWVAWGAAWLAAQVFTWGWPDPSAANFITEDGIFSQALAYYLKGNWFEAERALNRRLASTPTDVDARLMLVSLLRHTRRQEEAQRQLDTMEHYQGAYRWELEIARERRLLAQMREETQVDDSENLEAEPKIEIARAA